MDGESCEYIFQLPPTVIWDLAGVLDRAEIWEEVGLYFF